MKDKVKKETRALHPAEEKFSLDSYGICQEDVTDADLAYILRSDTLVTGVRFVGYNHLVVTITPKEGTPDDAVRRHRVAVRNTVSTLLYSIPKRKAAAARVEAGRFAAEHPYYD